MPNCIGDDFLVSKIWKTRPTNVWTMLDMVVADLDGVLLFIH